MKKIRVTTTFAKLHEAGACKERYKHLAKALGGVTKYGRNKPINLLQILEHNGYEDFEWAFLWGISSDVDVEHVFVAIEDLDDTAEQLKIAKQYLK